MIRQLVGDARVQLATLEPESVQTVITSPPYYGLRDYGTEPLVWGQTCCEHPHQWAAAERAPWANELPSANSVTKRNNAYHETMGKTAGQFCSHVHEWSAVIKPAANGIVHSAMQGETLNGTSGTRKPSSSGVCPCGAWLGSLGLEPTPELFVEHLVEVFRGVRRILRPDGLLWVNLGDSYAGSGKGPSNSMNKSNPHSHEAGLAMKRGLNNLQDTPTQWVPLQRVGPQEHTIGQGRVPDMKPKDLLMMPSRLAIALQADGWWLRSMIPWLKRNCMPESCNDRPTSAIEYWFLFSRSRTYYWDAYAVRSTSAPSSIERAQYNGRKPNPKNLAGVADGVWKAPLSTAKAYGQGRNRRNADWFIESWQGLLADDDAEPLAFVVNPTPFQGSHFATFPPRLVEPMIRASTSDRGCCPECGASWGRVVAKEVHTNGMGRAHIAGGDPTIGVGWEGTPRASLSVSTVGWRPACAHYDARYMAEFQQARRVRKRDQRRLTGDWWRRTRRRAGRDSWPTVPAIVLDCFGGAGTVGLVADRLDRDAVLVDLKPGYADMARERLVGDAPMFVEIEGAAASGMSPEPIKDKQGALGKRTYSGFNARWDAREAAGE